MKNKIGVIGSADENNEGKEIAKQVGREIAKSDSYILTGGCTGLPYAAIKGAKEEGGFTVGISPATNLEEHVEDYNYPPEHHDLLIYTGFGLKGRNVTLIRSCDAVIALGGSMGTLNELTIAYSQRKIIGLLKSTGGATSEFSELAKKIGRPGRTILEENDPKTLIKRIEEKLKSRND